MKNFSMILLMIVSMISCSSKGDELKELPSLPDEPVIEEPNPIPGSTDKIVVGYVTSWSNHEVKPEYVTHINYAFGYVQGTFRGIGISNEERLRSVVALKKQASHLKVLLSIGGWGSGNFSEMAADADNRLAFAADCKRVIDEFGLDGIDIDWEFPTSNMAGISSSPDDTRNYNLMMRDIRQAIGSNKLLTLATVCSADYIDFEGVMPILTLSTSWRTTWRILLSTMLPYISLQNSPDGLTVTWRSRRTVPRECPHRCLCSVCLFMVMEPIFTTTPQILRM